MGGKGAVSYLLFFKLGPMMEMAIMFLGLSLCFPSVSADSKAVTTSLTAKWPSTPLLLEAR
ncbi:hypothetical protein GDO86_010377 [Hymenochirus boettgeri]|uniref:Uncharacterized protein n=1 Tax=Hymenochirus boettgeri TaxID=247094 RepID=A0A8T2JT70_9PIPI|nr:hypothetical protein GDO86_010377 [Hymenochirus boettgeri]